MPGGIDHGAEGAGEDPRIIRAHPGLACREHNRCNTPFNRSEKPKKAGGFREQNKKLGIFQMCLVILQDFMLGTAGTVGSWQATCTIMEARIYSGTARERRGKKKGIVFKGSEQS
jgi:hypothetical protein